MFTKIPFTLDKRISSNKGLLMAAWAASYARFSLLDTPTPIRAMPVPVMTVLTSAKSRLLNCPRRVINSAMPCTALCKTLSTSVQASAIKTSLSKTPSNFSLGMVMSESTFLDSSSMACSAMLIRTFPST